MLTFSVNPSIYEGFKKINKSNLPTTEKGKEWLGTVWLNAHKLGESVDVDAYGYKCDENTQKKNQSREVTLLSNEELEEGKKGVSESVAFYYDNKIEDIIEKSEIVTISEEFFDMREYLIAEADVDIWYVLTKAMEHNKRAMMKLKELSEEFSMYNLIKDVLRPDCLQHIKGVMA